MSKPKTLYEACEQAAEAIETMPLNYNQQHWECPVYELKDKLSALGFTHAAKRAAKACGTAYCRAGHIMCAVRDCSVDFKTAANGAKELIAQAGIPDSAMFDLFKSQAVEPASAYGTKDYVKEGADGLRRFMSRWEKELKGLKL